ncbi:serine/threonine-protein kinase 17B [Callorhinchus milii]|uniref:Serine/threonine-protein kinase 17B n=1 Tax=Callorhinchus milii TaxID=7868 RepID=V9KJX7_CALMI|nr:serine/threonine-protein kinase 17B [Callorhinchus milii]|eukprot:gi/632946055/ref/XP_007888368.1/ PREDICTED: serine/threonine-protein kinase 17B [Callorhinchus milii]
MCESRCRRMAERDKQPVLFTRIQTPFTPDSFHHKYTVLAKELGRGKFAVVKKCIEKATGKEYAAKFLKKRRRGLDCKAEIIHEIAVLEVAKSNPRVIDLYEVYETTNEIILVLEYAAGGELFSLCVADPEETSSENDVIRLVRQIIEGVNFLHQNNIVHLDLKPQNILLSSSPPLGDIKIVDFGLSRRVGSAGELREITGTPEYVAPEILNYEPISTATDMWSIGVLTYMLLTGESPFQGEDKQETFLNISQVNVDYSDEVFDGISKTAIEFIEQLLVKNPEERSSAEVCLSHLWLQAEDMSEPVPEIMPYISQSGEQHAKPLEEKNAIRFGACKHVDKENITDESSIVSKRLRFDDSYKNCHGISGVF